LARDIHFFSFSIYLLTDLNGLAGSLIMSDEKLSPLVEEEEDNNNTQNASVEGE